jgi:hypothetical protein
MAADALEAFVDEGIVRTTQGGYPPTEFIRMRARYGTVKAMTMLVKTAKIQKGFKKLQKLGLLKWSVEAAILKFPDRFSEDTQKCAKFRLRWARSQNPPPAKSAGPRQMTSR